MGIVSQESETPYYDAPLLQPNELPVLLPEPWTSELAKLLL